MITPSAVKKFATASGLSSVYLHARRIVCKPWSCIVAYHRVDCRSSYPWAMKPLAPDSFEAEVIKLKRHYNIVPLHELALANQSQENSHKHNLAAITFDDGFRDNYLHAFPILKKHNLPATIFLVTNPITERKFLWSDRINYACWHTAQEKIELDEVGVLTLNDIMSRSRAARAIKHHIKNQPFPNRKALTDDILSQLKADPPPEIAHEFFLRWSDIVEMSEQNIYFGAHTYSHERLSELTEKQAALEIEGSKQDIETNLGKEVHAFAYPFGSQSDYTDEIVQLVKRAGFRCAVTLSSGIVNLGSANSDLFRLTRISGAKPADFEFAISGALSDVKRLMSGVRDEIESYKGYGRRLSKSLRIEGYCNSEHKQATVDCGMKMAATENPRRSDVIL